MIQDKNHSSEIEEDDEIKIKSILESSPKDVPFAPSEELKSQDIVIKKEDSNENITLDLKSKFKSQENILTAIDDLLISGGARLILFCPYL